MTKSKTDKHLTKNCPTKGVKLSPKVTYTLTLSYKKTISKSDLHPLKGVGNGKIDVFKELKPHSRTF